MGNLRDFDRLLALLGAQSGALLNQADLGGELGVSANTVKAWISILEASGQIYVCPAYYESLGKRVIKSPRVHLLDCGLLSRLTGTTTPEQVLRGPMAGSLFESLVGGELLRLMTNAGEPPRLYHWRTVGGNEVDFVFETGGRIFFVKVRTMLKNRIHTLVDQYPQIERYDKMKSDMFGKTSTRQISRGLAIRRYYAHSCNVPAYRPETREKI